MSGVVIHGGPRASSLLHIPEARSLHHEYSSLACTIEIVDDVYAAIDHIHRHGRHVDISNRSPSKCTRIFVRARTIAWTCSIV